MPFKVSFVGPKTGGFFEAESAHLPEISYTTARSVPTSDDLIVRGANGFLNFGWYG
jgi:hypothetical protein